MDRPSDLLRQHVAKGRQIQANMAAAGKAKKLVNTNVDLGVEVINAFFNLSGKKRLVTNVGKTMARSSADYRRIESEAEAKDWTQEAKSILKKISVLRDGIPNKPNSQRLVESFSTSIRYVRPETRISHGIMHLEELASRGTVFNSELEEMRRAIDKVQSKPMKIPTSVEMGLGEMLRLVEPFPEVRVAISGALAAYGSKGADWQRQTLSSLRNALESIVKFSSGENDFPTGLAKVVRDKNSRKSVKSTYDLLSARGVHNKEIPTEFEVIQCIGLTQYSFRYVINSTKNG